MLQQRKYWAINDHEPSQVRSTHFDVREGSVQLTASGLAPGEVLDIEVRVDGGLTRVPNQDHYWAKLWRHGWKVQMRSDHTQLVINIPGTYRIVKATPTAGPVAVAVWESDGKFEFTELNSPKGSASSDAGGDVGEAPETVANWDCAAPRLPLGDTVVSVERCDAVTSAPVTLFMKVTRPDNSQCPPIPGSISIVGYMDASGAYGAGAYPGSLASCTAPPCAPSAPRGVIATWG